MSLKSLVSLFVDTGDDKQEAPEKAAAPVSGVSGLPGIAGIPGISVTPAPVPPVAVPTSTAGSDPALSSNFVEKLRGKFANSPVFTTIQHFQSACESLAEAIPQEGNRVRAAVNLLQKTAGVDQAKLAEAYTTLLGVLDAEAQKFEGVLRNQKATEIDAREQQVQAINAQIEAKNAEIAAMMNDRDAIAVEITTQKTKLGAAAASFEGATQTLRSEISDTLNKLKIFLPAATPAK